MKQSFQKMSLQFISKLLLHLTTYTVNSACIFGLGQPKEPESLKRLKR